MANVSRELDAHQKAPEQMRALFKKFQESSNDDLNIIDPERLSENNNESVKRCGMIPSVDRLNAFEYMSNEATRNSNHQHHLGSQDDAPIYEVQALPGQPERSSQ